MFGFCLFRPDNRTSEAFRPSLYSHVGPRQSIGKQPDVDFDDRIVPASGRGRLHPLPWKQICAFCVRWRRTGEAWIPHVSLEMIGYQISFPRTVRQAIEDLEFLLSSILPFNDTIWNTPVSESLGRTKREGITFAELRFSLISTNWQVGIRVWESLVSTPQFTLRLKYNKGISGKS